jgi:hypothetical protein
MSQAVSRHTYETVHAPPATVFLQALQVQIPTECRFTVFLPQKVHTYRACCVISIFLTCFRREAPYLYYMSQRPHFAQMSVLNGFESECVLDSVQLTWCHIYQSHRPLFRKASQY